MISYELIKFLILMPFLLYATWSDLKSMSVSNKFMKVLLFVIIVVSLLNYTELPNILMSGILVFVIMLILFSVGALGGADGKLLTLIAMLFPSFIELRNIFPFTVVDSVINLNSNTEAFLSFKIPFTLIVYINAAFISGLAFAFIFRKYKLSTLLSEAGKIKIPFVPFITAGLIITWLFVNKSIFGG